MRKRTGKKIRNRIEYLLLMGFTYIIWAIPLNGLYFMASVLGGFIFSVLRIRRKVVLNNLKLAFPDKTDHERLMIARKTYQHFARMTFEVIRMPRMGKDELFSLGVMKDQNVLDKALQGEKGAILLTGHFGNWELYAASLARHGYPISSLVKTQHNPLTDEVLNQFRTKMGIKVIPLGIAMRGVVHSLRTNRCIGMVADQDAGPGGEFIKFFNQPTSTASGPAILALKYGAPLIFGISIKMKNGKYLFVGEKIPVNYKKGLSKQNIRSVMQEYSKRLEKAIREHPDHWFWMHKRWKTEPPKQDNPLSNIIL